MLLEPVPRALMPFVYPELVEGLLSAHLWPDSFQPHGLQEGYFIDAFKGIA